MVQYKRIGDMLLERGEITQAQLDKALQTKIGTSLRFGEILTALGFVEEETITECLADQYGYKVANISLVEPEQDAINLVPSITALSGLVLPVKVTDERFYCIIADPLDIPMTDSLFRLSGRPVEFSLASPTPLFDKIVEAYNIGPRAKQANIAKKLPRRSADAPKEMTSRPKRKIKIDAQEDRQALLSALSGGLK